MLLSRLFPSAKKKEKRRKRREQELALIAEHFDEHYYLKNYPDVAKADVSPLVHFVDTGWKLNYDPCAHFSTSFYLDMYPDVAESGNNPFYHFLKYGHRESRFPLDPLAGKDIPIFDIKEEEIPDEEDPTFVEQQADELQEVKDIIGDDFDPIYYASKYLTEQPEIDPLHHFVTEGWKNGFDPCKDFSVEYYLDINSDIAQAGINPFYHYVKHGKKEGRSPVGTFHASNTEFFKPLVSAIIPNYNHAKYLPERIDSILNQTYEHIEIIILDDCSKDNSREVIDGYCKKYPDTIRSIYNEDNSGNVFRQWRKGVNAAKGELLWICESDDMAHPKFLEGLVHYFFDSSIMIGFGNIQFVTAEGEDMPGLDGFREGAERGIWDQTIIRSANKWFNGAWGVRNIIPNVGGCLIRNQQVTDEVWNEAQKYKVLGDWYLYSMLANGGAVVYEPTSYAFFRQHGKNTSVTSFKTDQYYKEHFWFIKHIINKWGINERTIDSFVHYTKFQYTHHFGQEKEADFFKIFDAESLYKEKKEDKHVLIGFLGFHYGGGELFPIHLSNELLNHGYTVSMLAIDRTKEYPEIKNQLDKRIPVYSLDPVKSIGPDEFADLLGVDVINTHYIGLEYHMLLGGQHQLPAPYVVTLHGSYEVSNLSAPHLIRLLQNVQHWIFTADKNLSHFGNIPLSENVLTKVQNAMAYTDMPFPESRESLGIKEGDLVLGMMARAIPSKGWEEAILSLLECHDRGHKNIHLLLVGKGKEQERLEEIYGDHPNIQFLGFQSNVHGFFRLCDICLLPTKFKGESYPLVLIQSMQVGTPMISVNVGEINNMLFVDKLKGGITIELGDSQEQFVNDLADSIIHMSDKKQRKKYAKDSLTLGANYSIDKVAKTYTKVFDEIITQKRLI